MGVHTAVLDLSPHHVRGGLFVMDAQGRKESARLVPLESGDLAVHSYNLQHGVDVVEGERLSLIMWFDLDPRCPGPQRSWYEEHARSGDAVAANHLAQVLSHPWDQRPAAPEELQEPRTWYTKAAEGGILQAQHNLGSMLFLGEGGPPDFASAVHWTME